jgi:acetyl esterase
LSATPVGSADVFDLARLLSPEAARSPEYEAVWRWVLEQDKLLPDQTGMSVQEQRAVRALVSARWNQDPPAVASVERLAAPGLAGAPDVVCELSVPFGAEPGAILYLHGGGWVFGGLSTHVRLARTLAIACNRAVLAVDYRLAPEHPFGWSRRAAEIRASPARSPSPATAPAPISPSVRCCASSRRTGRLRVADCSSTAFIPGLSIRRRTDVSPRVSG